MTSRADEPLPTREEATELLEAMAQAGRLFAGPLGEEAAGPSEQHPAEARYRALVEQIPAVTFAASLRGGLSDVYVSPQIEDLLGYSREEWLRDPVLWFRRLHPDDRGLWNREFARGVTSGGPFRAECRFLARDGHVVWVHGEARIIPGPDGAPAFLQGVAFDITETKEAEALVQRALKQKDLLLREIHHRVKNNLQITSSLLRLQARHAAPEVVAALEQARSRIQAMALVHEKLYRSGDLSHLRALDYVRGLVRMVGRGFARPGCRVTTRVTGEDAELPLDQAIPCGLIVSELVSNAFKHAFPDREAGVVEVTLAVEEGEHVMMVRDDGVGLPAGSPPEGATSLGLRIVRTLTDQIGGRLDVLPGPGASFRVTFPTNRSREGRS